MLTTDAYVFFDITDPICAWSVARGVVVTAPVAGRQSRGFISLRMVKLFRDRSSGRFGLEMRLEAVRSLLCPEKISRLVGAFCFPDKTSAELAAAKWMLKHFPLSNMTEVHLYDDTRRDLLDSNWITHAPRDSNGALDFTDQSWMEQYWSGIPYPDHDPIWEMLTDGRMVILDPDKQLRAFDVVKSHDPESLGFLEISRAAAFIGSDLFSHQAFLLREGDDVRVTFLLSEADAKDPAFCEYFAKQNPIMNPHLLAPHFAADSFGRVPDYRRFEFLIPIEGTTFLVDQFLAREHSQQRSIARSKKFWSMSAEFQLSLPPPPSKTLDFPRKI